MKKFFTYSIVGIIAILGMAIRLQAQLSANTVKYKITYDTTTQTYTAWVTPDYSVPNANNAGATEKGATAQFTIVVPKDFVITQITDIRGVWTKPNDSGFIKLGPGNVGQTWPATLDPSLNYYVVGKTTSETDYGTFVVGTSVSLFSFKGNGCYGPIKPLPANDPFIVIADNSRTLNVGNSFYSRSGQRAGGNVVPLEQFVNITGTPANCSTPKAIYAYDDNNIANKGVAVSGNVLSNDDKGTGTAPLVVTTTPVMQPANGTVTLNANGTYTYTPNGSYVGTDAFKYRVCDSGTPAICDTATVTINITDPSATANRPPIVLADNNTTFVNTSVSGNLLNNDADPDAGQTLTASIVTQPAHGTVVFSPNGTYTYTPTNSFVGSDIFTYKACDNGTPQLCVNATVNLSVGTNSGFPVANADLITRCPTCNATGNLLNNDILPPGSTITTTAVVSPTNGTVVINPDGTFTYTPNSGYTGSDKFTYEVCTNATPKQCSQAVAFILPKKTTTGSADLKITKMLEGSKTRAIGDIVTYKIVLKNLGTDAATNVVVKDSVMAGLLLQSGTANKGTYSSPLWSIPTLASGDSALLTVTAKVQAEGVSMNYAIIKSADQTDKNTSNNIANACVTVPVRLCTGQALDLTLPANYSSVVWFRNGTQVAMGNTYTATQSGIYTFNASNNTCPANGCCGYEVIIADCCNTNLCVPVTTVKRKL